MKKINNKSFWITTLASFVFMAVYEFLVHGLALRGLYEQTPELWRTDADMNMILMMVFYALLSAFLVCLFVQMNVRDIKAGAKAGLAVGLPFALAGAGSFLWMPISIGLAAAWFVAILIKVVAIGKITGWLYKD